MLAVSLGARKAQEMFPLIHEFISEMTRGGQVLCCLATIRSGMHQKVVDQAAMGS